MGRSVTCFFKKGCLVLTHKPLVSEQDVRVFDWVPAGERGQTSFYAQRLSCTSIPVHIQKSTRSKTQFFDSIARKYVKDEQQPIGHVPGQVSGGGGSIILSTNHTPPFVLPSCTGTRPRQPIPVDSPVGPKSVGPGVTAAPAAAHPQPPQGAEGLPAELRGGRATRVPRPTHACRGGPQRGGHPHHWAGCPGTPTPSLWGRFGLGAVWRWAG